jgi:membrane fusion protein (multidrug efflux system)
VIRRHFFLVAASVLLVLMLVAGGITLLAGKSGGDVRSGRGDRAVKVATTAIGLRSFLDEVAVLGVAKGRQSVTITSDTAELVTSVNFTDGQAVAKDQVLVTLKATEQDAGLAEAQAREDQARRDSERWALLAERGVAPRATAEQYQAQYRTAVAATAAARARKLDRVIRAPFAGVVGLSDIAPGALVSPGAAIVSLDDLSVIRVDFDVPDRYLAALGRGGLIEATPDVYPQRTFVGRIAQLDTRINSSTRAITARAEFRNPDGVLRPGMLMQVRIRNGARQSLAAPESALQYEGDLAFVFSVVERNGRAIARKTLVTTGASADGMVEIKSGVKPGDRLVADGLNRLQDGQAISLPGAPRGDMASKGSR